MYIVFFQEFCSCHNPGVGLLKIFILPPVFIDQKVSGLESFQHLILIGKILHEDRPVMVLQTQRCSPRTCYHASLGQAV